jgi:hypothetical protein
MRSSLVLKGNPNNFGDARSLATNGLELRHFFSAMASAFVSDRLKIDLDPMKLKLRGSLLA